MADEATTDVNEINFDFFGEDVEQTTTAESSTGETKAEVSEPEADTSTTEPTEDEAEAAGVAEEAVPEGEKTTTEEPKPRGADARREALSNEIRTLANQKRELAAEVARLNATAYQADSADELVATGVDPAIARLEAFEQRTALAEYTAQVAEVTSSLHVSSLEVMKDYPEFDKDSDQYDEAFANRVGTLYNRVAGIKQDEKTGLISEAAVMPYDFYKEFAETRRASTQTGQVKGQQAAEKMLAKTEVAPVNKPTEKTDALLELWKS